MGMDLKPIAPTKDAPRKPADATYDPNGHIWGRYNWSGWSWIEQHLQAWGVDTHEFDGSNDGEKISAETCRKVADAIEAHIGELDEEHQTWLRPHIELWRTCGGYEQH